MSWLNVYLIGMLQALLLALLLFSSRNSRWSGNVYISGLLIIIALLLGIFSLRQTYGLNIYPGFFWIVVSTPALIGPMLLFYIKSIQQAFNFYKIENLLHVIPFIVFILVFTEEIVSAPFGNLSHLDNPDTIFKIMLSAYGKSLVILAYLIYCLKLLHREQTKPSTNLKAIRYLTFILWCFTIVVILGSVLSSLFWFGLVQQPLADNLELTFLTVLTYFLSFYVYHYDVKPLHPREKYANPQMTDSTRDSLATDLKQLLQEQRLFLQDNFSARQLAQALSITEQQLSELIALEFDSNFYSLCNHYRLEYFTELLKQRPDEKLLTLAFTAGFNSKSSFNRIVKELTQQTPSQYRKRIIEDNHP